MISTVRFPIGNDFYYAFTLAKPDGTMDTGRTDLAATLSDTEAGPAITGMPNYTPTEAPANSGVYNVTIPGADSTAHVGTGRVGAPGWIVITEGTALLACDQLLFCRSQRVGS